MTAATPPDFEALRAQRNAQALEAMQRIAAEWGEPLESLFNTFNPGACYCACASGGPCEHQWDGTPYECDGTWSRTCSRCGTTAIGHSLRTAP